MMSLRPLWLALVIAGPALALVGSCFPSFEIGSSTADAGADVTQGPDSTAADGMAESGGDGASTDGRPDGQSGDGGDASASTDGGVDAAGDSSQADSGGPPFEAGPPFDASGSVVIPMGTYTVTMHDGTCNAVQRTVTIDYNFAIDQYETTVDQFARWVDAGMPSPCDGGTCQLDPKYPKMTWQQFFGGALVTSDDYTNSSACSSEPNSAGESFATYTVNGGKALPITCVNWSQAEAYCVWANKRLPTETEWMIAAQGQPARDYPWGSNPDGGCAFATLDGCPWPAQGGSALAGATPTTPPIYDLVGSVSEWLWDYTFSGNCYAYPADAGTDYPGPDHGASIGNDYVASSYRDPLPFVSPPGTPLWNQLINSSGSPNLGYQNTGMRCVRSF